MSDNCGHYYRLAYILGWDAKPKPTPLSPRMGTDSEAYHNWQNSGRQRKPIKASSMECSAVCNTFEPSISRFFLPLPLPLSLSPALRTLSSGIIKVVFNSQLSVHLAASVWAVVSRSGTTQTSWAFAQSVCVLGTVGLALVLDGLELSINVSALSTPMASATKITATLLLALRKPLLLLKSFIIYGVIKVAPIGPNRGN